MVNNSWAGKRVVSYLTNPYVLTGVFVCSYLLVAWFLGIYLHFEFLQSDVLGYWKESLDWQTPFDVFHVPGYPLMIAILREITFNALPPVLVMMGINLAAYSISVFLVYRILETTGVDRGITTVGVLLFGLWPFVGLTYAVDPLADLPAISLFLAGTYALQHSRRNLAALFFGLSLITHKALWLAIGILVAMDFFTHKKYLSKQNLTFLGVTILPIGILWLLGSFYHGSLTWLISSNTEVEISSRSSLPIFDGLIGTLLAGGVRGIVKGILLMGFAVLTVFSLYFSASKSEQNVILSRYGIAVSIAILVLFVILNQSEIWAAIRFSRLLAIPLALSIGTLLRAKRTSIQFLPVIALLVLILLASQFIYAWYMARVYFG